MADEWEELELEEEDIYNERKREKELDEGSIEDWEGAWMDGYNEVE